jgi:hypothetical protein
LLPVCAIIGTLDVELVDCETFVSVGDQFPSWSESWGIVRVFDEGLAVLVIVTNDLKDVDVDDVGSGVAWGSSREMMLVVVGVVDVSEELSNSDEDELDVNVSVAGRVGGGRGGVVVESSFPPLPFPSPGSRSSKSPSSSGPSSSGASSWSLDSRITDGDLNARDLRRYFCRVMVLVLVCHCASPRQKQRWTPVPS